MESSPRWAEKEEVRYRSLQSPLHSWFCVSVTRDLWSWGRLCLVFLKISMSPKLYGKEYLTFPISSLYCANLSFPPEICVDL